MASLTMDNPLTPSPQVQLKKVVQDLHDCVASLKREFEEGGYPITDDSQSLHRLCAKLESLLQTGFKGKTSLFGDKKDYWNYFVDCIGSTKDLRDGIKFVKANSELRTSLGRGRAFLRFALVHQRLADTIQQCVCSQKQTNDWYHPRAVWLQPVLSSAIINSLYDLNDLQFDLLPRGYDLDTTWPTFARKSFGSPQSWASPPSRSPSISSLASSIPALEIPPSPSSHTAAHSTQHLEQLSQELNDSENERFSLQVKLESLKETKEMASNEVQTLQKKVKDLETECKDLEVQNESLKTQLKLKDSTSSEKEMALKCQIEQADQNMADLRNQIAAGGTVGMNIAELMAKLALQQKKNATLQIELKTSQLELQSKVQTDAGKTKLIELLDKKIAQLQDQNQRMLVQIETCAADRMRDADGNKSSHQMIEATMDRLKRADEINGKLQQSNDALRKMLETMEEKTTKISNMAKEKLTLYKAENTKLQLMVEQLSRELAKVKATGGVQTAEATTGDAGGPDVTSVADAAAAAVESALAEARKDVDMWKAKYDEVHAELEKAKDATTTTASAASENLAQQAAAGLTTAKLTQLEKEKGDTEKALAKSREEVKKVLIQKMGVDEESTLVEARQKEVQDRHQQLLVQLAHTESAVRKLESEIASVNEVVEAGEAQKEGAEEMNEDDSPLIIKVKNMIRAKCQQKGELQKLDVQNISLRKDLETSEKQVEDLRSDSLNSQLQIAELKTLVSQTEVASADMAAKLEEYESNANENERKNRQNETEEKFLMQMRSKENQIAELQNLLQEQKLKTEEETPRMTDAEDSTEITKGLESKLAEYKERYDYLMEEKVILESKCRDIEAKLKTTKQNLKKSDKENKKLLAERESLKTRLETLQNEVECLTLTNENLSTQMMEQEAVIMKSVEEKLMSLKNNVETEQKGRKKLESDLDSLRRRHQENEKLLDQMQKKKKQDDAEYKRNIQAKDKELGSLRKQKELFDNKLAAISSQYDEATTREVGEREEFKMEIDLLQCDLQKANTDLEEKQVNIQQTEEFLTKSVMELLKIDFSSENPGLTAMAMTMTDNLRDVQEQMAQTTVELENATQSAEVQSNRIKQLEENASNDSAKQKTLHSILDSSNKEAFELKEKLENSQSIHKELEEAIEAMKETSSASQTQWAVEKETLTKNIAELTVEAGGILEQTATLQQKLSEQEEEIVNVQSEKEQLEITLDKMKENFSVTQTESENEKENLTLRITDLTKERDVLTAESASMHTRLKEHEEQLVKLQDENKQNSAMQDILKDKESEIISAKNKLEQQESEFSRVREELGQELSALRFELSSQQMEHQQALQGLEGHASSISDLVGKLAAQESLIEMLEKDLELLKRERLLEKNRTLNELEELRQSLSGRDEECRLLNGELKRTSMLLDEERNLSLRFKNELTEVQAYYDRELGQSRKEVELLRKDAEVLKQQLIKIIKDKDALWQKTDKLEYLQKLTVAGSWMDDTDTTNCLACNATFSFMLRKHHCRLCGRIFCYSCCNQWVKTPHSSKKARICNDCASYHKSEMEKPTEEMLDENEEGPAADTQTETNSEKDNQTLKADDNQTLKADDTTEDEEAPSSFRPDDSSDDGFLTSATEEPQQAALLQSDALAVSPAVDAALDTVNAGPASPEVGITQHAEVVPDEAQKTSNKKKSAHKSETDAEDELYDVITPEEIVQSLHLSMIEADAHSHTSPMLTVEQIAAGEVPVDPGLCVRAGKSYLVPVFIDAPGIVLCWDFSTEPKGIHFSVTFRRDALTSTDLSEVLIPLCPCNSHRQAIQGELIAVTPGLYTLIFDNSTSRFTSKKLSYHLHVRKPEAAD